MTQGRHKETNQFRFRSFNERIQGVRVSAAHRLRSDRAVKLAAEDAESAFVASIVRWMELDLSRPFQMFTRDLGIKVDSYALVIVNQEMIFNTLCRHISLKHLEQNSRLALPALLEFFVSFSTDLASDFNKYFFATFERVCALLKTQDLQLLEHIFTCLSRLVKLSQRHLRDEIEKSLRCFVDLVSNDSRPYIQSFAGDAFAFLLRKHAISPNYSASFWSNLCGSYSNYEPADAPWKAFGMLVFQAVRGVQNGLDSRFEAIMKPLLAADSDQSCEIIRNALELIFEHLHRDKAVDLLNLLLSESTEMADERRMRVLTQLVDFKCGVVVYDVQKIVLFLDDRGKKEQFSGVTELVRALLQSIIPINERTRAVLIGYLARQSALSDSDEATRVLKILHSVVAKDWFADALPHCSDLISDVASFASKTADSKTILEFLVAFINTTYNSTIFDDHNSSALRLSRERSTTTIGEDLLVRTAIDEKSENLSWAALFVLSHMATVDEAHLRKLVENKETIRARSNHCKGQLYLVAAKLDGAAAYETVVDDLEEAPSNLALLKATKEALRVSEKKLKNFEKLQSIVAVNLQHWNYAVRTYSLQILIRITEDHKDLEILTTLLDAEREGVSMGSYRDRLRFLRKVGTALSAEGVGSALFSNYLYGSLTINFTLLAQETRKLFSENLRRQFTNEKDTTAEFWLNHMRNSMTFITTPPANHEGDSCEDFELFPDLRQHFCPLREGVKESPDWLSMRDQIWSISESLSEFLEPVSRKIIPMFFDFYSQEYERKLKFQNILPLQNTTEEKAKVSRQKTKKMLASALKLFARFQNPAKLYREPELKALCIELLLHQDFVLQRCAVDYLAAYKKSVACRHHALLQELCDNAAYRSRFTKLMSSDHEINEIDYDPLVHYALRISFGKMLSQIKEKAGKNSAQVRQRFIVRQISDSAVIHLQTFYDLSTQSLAFLTEEHGGAKCWPLGKQIGTLQTIHTIINNVNWGSSEVMEHFRMQILEALVKFGNNTGFLLGLENVRPHCKSQLKDIRTLAIKSLLDLSERTKISYTSAEKRTIFKWIGSLIVNMKQDSVDQVGPTLRLVCAWAGSEYTRDMLLHKLDDATVLFHLVAMLKPKLAGKEVSASIIKVVSQLFAEKEDYWPDELRDAIGNIIPILINFFVPSIENSSPGLMDKETLQLIILISLDIEQPAFCSKLIYVILDQFKSRVQHLKKELLGSIVQLIPKAEGDRETLNAFASRLVGLVSTVGEETGVRMELVSCFAALAEKEDSYVSISKIVAGFNAVRKHLHDPIDFDKRIDTINALTKEANGSPDFSSNFLYWRCTMVSALYQFKSVDDMSIQTATNRLIFSICEKVDPNRDTLFFAQLIRGIVLPEIRRMLKSRNERLRHEYIAIFAKLVALFRDDSELGQFSELLNEDPDHDFFQNITHIQHHRRRHAFKQIIEYIENGTIKGAAANRYIFPMALSTLLDSRISGKTAVLEEALEVVCAIAKCMSWSSYRRLLDMQLNLALKNSKISTEEKVPEKKAKRTILPQRDHEAELKMTIKIICKILEALHWPLEKLDDAFIFSVTRFSRESGVTIKHIREFEEIQLQKEKKTEDPEGEEPMVIDALTGKSGSEIKEENNDSDDEEPDEVQNEQEEELMETDEAETKEREYPIGLLQKVYTYLHLVVRPKLYKLVTRREDVNVDAEADEQVIHIPLASALIKVLCTLGLEAIRSYCPSIILKIVDMLRSRNFSQREIARKALVSALNILGDRWFGLFIEELQAGLQRGYQKHVQIASISALLHGHEFETGTVDDQIQPITDTLLSDLVGEQGKEKKIGKIVGKTPEAKGKNYSIGCYKRLAQVVSPGALNSLIQPIKDRILNSTDLKDHVALFGALKAICEGLISNDAFDGNHLVILSAQILSENSAEEAKAKEKQENKKVEERRSCLLLDENDTVAPKAKASHKKITNKHYLNQFALSVLISGIKFDKIDLSLNSEHLAKLDGILQIMIDMLDSNRHSDEAMFIFRLLQRMLKNPRFSTLHDPKQFTKLAEKLFFVLKNQCRGNASNSEYVSAAFKAVTALISSDYGPLSDDYLLVLIGYAEEDLFNNERQAAAFPLLHAMLKKNKVCDEMEYIGNKVFKLSIQADTEAGRSSARNFFIQFLIDYPLGPLLLEKYVNKLLGNTNYGIDTGRESVIASIRHVVAKFPEKMMRPRCSIFFTVLATSFSTDESLKVREDASIVLKELTAKYPSEDYANLTCEYLQHDHPEKIRLGCLLVGFLSEELKSNLQPEVVVAALSNLVNDEDFASCDDALLVALFDALQSLFENFDLEKSFPEATECFAKAGELHLSHPHTWVRERAARLILALVKGKSFLELKEAFPSFWDEAKVRSIAKKCLLQFKCQFVDREEMEPVKFLVIWVLDEFLKKYDQETEENDGKRSELLWIAQKLNGVAAEENSDRPSETTRRELVIELFLQFIIKHKSENIPHLSVMMEVLAREATAKEDSKQTPEMLRKLSHKGATVVEKMIGTDKFGRAWEAARVALSSRREKRGRVLQAKAVTDPEAFNLMKIAKQEKEKARRKRRLQELKMSDGKKRSKMNTLDKM